MNKTILGRWLAGLFGALALSGCVKSELDGIRKESGKGTVKLNLQFAAADPGVIVTRATNLDDLMSEIDNVHVMIFSDEGVGTPGNTDDDKVIFRTYFHYGKEQHIFLEPEKKYLLYVVANLDASNTNIGNAETFFDDVETLGDLREKYVLASSRSVEQIGKMVMATKEPIEVELPRMADEQVNMTIGLQRLNTKVIFNVFNKINSATDKTVKSGVYPSSWNVIGLPTASFLMERQATDPRYPDGTHDYPTAGANEAEIESRYTISQAQVMPELEAGTIFRDGNYYSRQTFHLFMFENRRGSNPDITHVYQREDKKRPHSTCVQLTCLTPNGEKPVLVHYIHLGKGYQAETDSPLIDNFDVDRSCIYYMNVYINGATETEILIDSRREYLDNHVIFILPDVSHIDGHYLDIPSYVAGMNGYVKLQTGRCTPEGGQVVYETVDGKQRPKGWEPMLDSEADAKRWLRISFYNPYRPSAKTSLYSSMNKHSDAFSGATPILHFNEYVSAASSTAGDPAKRIGIIRVGYVPGALNATEYDQGVAQGFESVFYVPISQYSIKTVGQVGGYDGVVYTSLLGVESVEEYTFPYYYRSPGADVPNNGPAWYYKPGLVENNQPYDGKRATTDHYEEYRDGKVPPKRGENGYNPVFNTNAADYCMRKNRDEDGDGIIAGAEIKWYLPTPAQLMQISIWRDELKYTFDPAVPFTQPYWTTNEADEVNAYALDFSSKLGTTFTAEVLPFAKTRQYPVRCVRDIAGTTGTMIFVSNTHIAVNLNGNLPASMLLDKAGAGWSDNQIREPNGNAKMQDRFRISRWYVTDKNNVRNKPPLSQGANNNPNCSNYAEDYNGTSWTDLATWRLPTQRELAFIYANSGMIENLMATAFPGAYHTFWETSPSIHWGSTNDGNNSTFWGIDFNNGYSRLYKSGNGYIRCVKYIKAGDPL